VLSFIIFRPADRAPRWLCNTLIALMLAYARSADQYGEERTMQRLTIWVSILVAMMAGAAAAQTTFYPAQGQATAKQSQDLTACRSWAQQQTGVTPGAPAAQAAPRVGGRARGAAAGATAAAITGNDAGKGAAAGAVGGAAAQRGARRQGRRQASAQQQQASSTFDRAVAACMQGRGYTGQ
jgi:hypothetical protein